MRCALARTLAGAALFAGVLFCPPGAARAQGTAPDLDHINLTYRGGPLIQHPKVVTLFWGSGWATSSGLVNTGIVSYLNNFFTVLFADGAFMANLVQYSTNGFQIGNGSLAGTAIDATPTPDPTKVTDAQIQDEIALQIQSGKLPATDADTMYFVFTPPGLSVVGPNGVPLDQQAEPVAGYHYSSRLPNRSFIYAVVPPEVISDTQGNPLGISIDMTTTCGHELAEMVTDPQVASGSPGWFDDKNGEVVDIVDFLALAAPPRINAHGYYDLLVGPDGTGYLVEKLWSNQDKAPVAFAIQSGTLDPSQIHLMYGGGPLVQQPKVVTLFWGSLWGSNPNIVASFNNFYKSLFADGAFMANLAQYSSGAYQIGNGTLAATATHAVATSSTVTDAQIQNEISAQIDAGALPAPDADTVYHVFLLPGTVLVNAAGQRSNDTQKPFLGYHGYSRSLPSRRFAYIATLLPIVTNSQGTFVDTATLTIATTRILAGAVTNPQTGDANNLGWNDSVNGEVGDIVAGLFTANPPSINVHGLEDLLVGDRLYRVQKVWSNHDNKPVAFAQQGP